MKAWACKKCGAVNAGADCDVCGQSRGEELLPCPFCGSSGVKRRMVVLDMNFVECAGCGGLTDCHNTMGGAIRAWNMRTPAENTYKDAEKK